MPRNGSGTDTIPNSFTPATVISSTAMNANFTDIAAEITNSVAVDGQSTMTGALKAAPGAALTPSITFGADTDTGLYRKGANQLGFATAGVERGYFDTTGTFVMAVGATSAGAIVDAFPTGTKLAFNQAAAPTGWTKDVTHNDKALRVVSGAGGGSGGSVAFTTAFASQTPTGTNSGTAITTAQMPLHGHPYRSSFNSNSGSTVTGGMMVSTAAVLATSPEFTGAPSDTQGQQIGGTGGGATHTHTFTGNAINLAVQYIDIIICTKN